MLCCVSQTESGDIPKACNMYMLCLATSLHIYLRVAQTPEGCSVVKTHKPCHAASAC